MQNFIFLACLEVAEKFVVVVVGLWSSPVLSLSFSQAEQQRKHTHQATCWCCSAPLVPQKSLIHVNKALLTGTVPSIKIKLNLLQNSTYIFIYTTIPWLGGSLGSAMTLKQTHRGFYQFLDAKLCT